MKRWFSCIMLFVVAGFPSLAAAGDCESTAVCPETDVNCDNLTDGFDIAVVRNTSNWLMDAEEADEPRADVNGDGIVDGFDIAAIRNTACWLQGGFTQTQLAGNSLEEYPWFEYVRAFNEDATVEVAIDPTRFPTITGQTCDIYIVEAKTEAEWLGDTSLTDVTPGGATTHTFSGTTVQANTVTVANPFDLDGDAGTGLGVGYDVVLDCDQDGSLSGSDFIDGFSEEAGLYAIDDITLDGPLTVTEIPTYSVGTVFGIPSGQTNEDIYYPTNIGTMGQVPMVVVSHGNGHNYQWYDHIGNYFASYGYVVMAHNNNTGPGIETASTTTLGHTDAFIDQLDTIGGGVLNGHVDTSRIMWIGHSRGAEGIARAYDRIFDGVANPTHYDLEDLSVLSSMLPTDFLVTFQSNPHDANYHLWTASGDADVDGSAGCDLCQTFHLHDRATNFRHSSVVQGTGHGDFHAASGSVFSGPCHIVPKSRVHDIMQGMFLPLAKYYFEGNIPAQDFFWRQYERFHPIGVPEGTDPCIVVSNTWHNGAPTGNVVIDNFQSQSSGGTSSSGGTVTFDVQNLTEGRLDDNNSSFSWIASDPMNGMTHASASDSSAGVVFDWTDANRFYEQGIVAALRDFSGYTYLSFRGGQGTQHPNTLAVLGDLTFTVTLRDADGTTSSINIGAYGGGFEQPYQRSGGWHNELETIRIRLTDFLANGVDLDLSNIAAIRFDFGPSWGSDEGRIGLDDIELTTDPMPEL